jgi:hypothetical protein
MFFLPMALEINSIRSRVLKERMQIFKQLQNFGFPTIISTSYYKYVGGSLFPIVHPVSVQQRIFRSCLFSKM